MTATLHTLRPKMLPTVRDMSENEIAQEVNALWLDKMAVLAAAAEKTGFQDGYDAGWFSGAVVGAALAVLGCVFFYAMRTSGCL